nr:hypothetical protein [Candidatus Sigynarchaeum springense]
MLEDADSEQKGMGFGFILAGPIAFVVIFLITKGSIPIELAIFLGFACVAMSVLGVLVLCFPAVYIVLRLILPED